MPGFNKCSSQKSKYEVLTHSNHGGHSLTPYPATLTAVANTTNRLNSYFHFFQCTLLSASNFPANYSACHKLHLFYEKKLSVVLDSKKNF